MLPDNKQLRIYNRQLQGSQALMNLKTAQGTQLKNSDFKALSPETVLQ